jgi:NADPH2:quinone reductase
MLILSIINFQTVQRSTPSTREGGTPYMKAILSMAPGGPETLVLADVAVPEPGPGEIRIRTKACAVNYPDALIINDLYQIKPERPFSPGSDVAGIVDAVGPGVREPQVGERVFGIKAYGAMAECVVLPAVNCMVAPPELPMEDAAALLLTYATAIHALKDRARLHRDETLLVLGAAGGTGIAAVELGKALGARVVAAVSTPEKAALATAAGADATLIWPTEALDRAKSRALADSFKEACGPGGADVIFDPVGGDYAEPALRAIAWQGRYLVVGFTAGIPRIPLNLPLLKACNILGVFWGAFLMRDPTGHRANMTELIELYRHGKIRPAITERYPLERAGDAIAQLAQRRARGKIVICLE